MPAASGMLGREVASIGSTGGITGSCMGPVKQSVARPARCRRHGEGIMSGVTDAPSTGPWTQVSPWLLAALLGGAGAMHFVAPEPYLRIVPDALPAPGLLVAVSGAAEIACGALVAWPRTRRVGGWATAALFVAVFPANVQMALDSRSWPPLAQAAAWGRLPLQVPLVWCAVVVARRAGRAR